MASQVTLFAETDFRGASLVLTEAVADLSQLGFNDRASSAKVEGEMWTLYLHPNYEGERVSLWPGDYRDLGTKNLNDAVSSVRQTTAEDAANAQHQLAISGGEAGQQVIFIQPPPIS